MVTWPASQSTTCVHARVPVFAARSSHGAVQVLGKKDCSALPKIHVWRKAVKRANEGVKRVLGGTNQDKAFAISDCGALSVIEDVMASNTTLSVYILLALLPRELCVLVLRPGTLCGSAACFTVRSTTILANQKCQYEKNLFLPLANLMPAKFSCYTVAQVSNVPV